MSYRLQDGGSQKQRSNLERRSVVVAFATHDIIGTHQKNSAYLLPRQLPQCAAQTGLPSSLVEIIKKEQSDTLKRKHAIGALQKLSLRKLSQYWMFDYDIIYHNLMILKNWEKTFLSEYTLEYITALIMNLSLSSRSKDALAIRNQHLKSSSN
ncbi:LisH domain-containing protein armc9 [Paramecium bursaria]